MTVGMINNALFADRAAITKVDIVTAATITALDSSKGFVRLTGSTATELQGILAGYDGQLLTIYNVSTAIIIFKHQNTGASAENRIITITSGDQLITSGGSAILVYNSIAQRWGLLSLLGNTDNYLLPIDITETVVSSNIQMAWDKYKNKYLRANLIIDIPAGDYATGLDLSGIQGDDKTVELRGDTRSLTGMVFQPGDNPNPPESTPNAGSGVIALSNLGNDITVTRASTNPNFAAEYSNADKIRIKPDVDTPSVEYSIAGISGNTITLTTTAPTVGQITSALFFVPNRKIGNLNVINPNGTIILHGLALESNGNSIGSLSRQGGSVILKKCAYVGFTLRGDLYLSDQKTVSYNIYYEDGIIIHQGGRLYASRLWSIYHSAAIYMAGGEAWLNSCNSISGRGVFCEGGQAQVNYCKFFPTWGIGLLAKKAGRISALSCSVKRGGIVGRGIEASLGGYILAESCTLDGNLYGCYAENGGMIISIYNTILNTTVNFSPSSTGVLGNNGSMVIQV